MFLGIEIGGTKLQLGVGAGDGRLVALRRVDVDRAAGAAAIRHQIERVGRELIAEHRVRAVGYGFGGPLDRAAGRTITSHQVAGWDDFPLAEWTQQRLGIAAVLNNDCDAAALAEARFGAGRGERVVFYVTVGTGIGGGLVVDGALYSGARSIAAEIGHLRPGPAAGHPHQTVESIAAGPGIVAAVSRRIAAIDDPQGETLAAIAGLEQLCHGDLSRLSAKDIAAASAAGNQIACDALDEALQTLGWAVGQVVTLLAPTVVVIGGGVSLIGEGGFFAPLRQYAARYAFGPLQGAYRIAPAALGEEVVVHGALAAAADAWAARPC
jgi:glucokinase